MSRGKVKVTVKICAVDAPTTEDRGRAVEGVASSEVSDGT